MYRLLVADDEPRQVRALANILRQLRPAYAIFTVGDGQEALDFIMKHGADIVITDIRMPNMDGLALAEKLNGLGIASRAVILSGYGEFEYAQKAMRYGVKEYVVKPVSRTDLQNILGRIEACLAEEKSRETQQEALIKKLDSSLPVYVDRQLNKWVYGSASEKDREEIKSIFPGKSSGTVLLTAFGGIQDLSEASRQEFFQWAKFTMREMLQSIGASISFFLEEDKYGMATVLTTLKPVTSQGRELIQKLNRFIERVRDEFGLTATVGAGEKTEDIFIHAPEAFIKAREALELRFFMGCGKVVFYPGGEGLAHPPFHVGHGEAEIGEALRGKDKTGILKATSGIFSALGERSGVRPSQVREELMYLLLNQAKSFYELAEDERYQTLACQIRQKTLQCEDYRELWHFTNKTLFELIDILGNPSDDKNGIIINKCKKYIQDNYMEDISLDFAAQKYSFNPSYFSSLFKLTTGLGFSEYLLEVRIKSAKCLLKDTELSMAEVAGKVGFRDPAYFNRMFKRQVGLSPLKYRQMAES